MEELKEILIAHAKRYPLMEPRDAVKLVYQNEFGGGHLIRDGQACLDYLRREYEATCHNAELPLYEEIGNGIVRVNLAAVKPNDLEQLGEAFIRSAAEHSGSMERFLEKLGVLRRLAAQGQFGFDAVALEAYLAEYIRSGCPAVSHSDGYRQSYAPAYRIVKRK